MLEACRDASFALREACTDGSPVSFSASACLLVSYRPLAIRQTRERAWHCVRTPLRTVSQRASTPGARSNGCGISGASVRSISTLLPAVAALMWSTLAPSVKRLWLGAGGLFIAGNLFKYYTWVIAHDAVSRVEQEAHEDASRQLREARDSAQKYALPPLKK